MNNNSVESPMKRERMRSFVLAAMFSALIIVMTVVPMTGYITVGPVEITTLHIVVAIASVVLLWMGIVFLTNGRDVVAMMESTFSSEWMRYVPLIGWYKAMIMYAVEGETGAFLLDLSGPVNCEHLYFGITYLEYQGRFLRGCMLCSIQGG